MLEVKEFYENENTFSYCFSATYVDVRPVSLSIATTVIFFPSGATVIFATSTTLPSRSKEAGIFWGRKPQSIWAYRYPRVYTRLFPVRAQLLVYQVLSLAGAAAQQHHRNSLE